jgi:hypothetical protein
VIPPLPYAPDAIDHKVPDEPDFGIQILHPRFEENVNSLDEAQGENGKGVEPRVKACKRSKT